MHFLVTGGAGFIGSHLVDYLLAIGHHVTVIDNLSTGKLDNLTGHPRLTFLEQDILNCHATRFTIQYDGLAHLAATPSVTQSWIEPLATHTNNLSATIAAIELCHRLEIPRIVFASSAAVYGNPIQVPISEDSATTPLSPYGLQKLVGEQYINLLSKYFGISAVNLRMFNVFGPRQDPHSPYSGVISIFTQAMMSGLPISISGKGNQTRDFIYVKDVALVFKKALTIPLTPSDCLTCNIGTGTKTSILQLKESLQKYFPQWTASTNFSTPRLGDIQDSQADISKAQLYLDFAPQFSVQAGLWALKESLNAQSIVSLRK